MMNNRTTPPCPTCGAPTVRRVGRLGPYWACAEWSRTRCKGGLDWFEYAPAMDEFFNFNRGIDPNKTAAWRRARELWIEAHAIGTVIAPPIQLEVKWPSDPEKEVKAKPKKKTKKELATLAATLAAAKRAGASVIPPSTFKPSPYQKAIFDWVDANNERNDQNVDALMVEALAGSGKTTTAIEMIRHIPTSQQTVFTAFNVHIKNALAAKMQEKEITHARVATCHGLGLQGCYRGFGEGIQVDKDGDKVQGFIEQALDKNTQRHLYPVVRQLTMLVKATLSSTSDEDLDELENHYGIEVNSDRDKIHAAVEYVIRRCGEDTKRVDFDDMIWLPVLHNLPVPQFDDVIVDEYQDINKAQRALLLMSVRADGRIIAVGDKFQSVYGFRGANTQSIPEFISSLNANVLPLSITYRNPKSVVALVNERFPHIPLQAAEWAKEGVVDMTLGYNKAEGMWADKDMVLCRTNAPLVKPAFGLIRRGIKAIIRGRDIGQGLIALIHKMNCGSVHELLRKLEGYRVEEVQRLNASNKTAQAQALMDKIETIDALSDGASEIRDIEKKIDTIFKDENAGVVFSSVHRAKGLEAERVFILQPDLMPHPMAKQPWEQDQERNIEYVALTRTLDQLYFVRE